jgi:hypothetical protein
MRGGMQKDLPPAKQPHVLSSSQRWNFTDLLISKVPKNLDLFSKKKTRSKLTYVDEKKTKKNNKHKQH